MQNERIIVAKAGDVKQYASLEYIHEWLKEQVNYQASRVARPCTQQRLGLIPVTPIAPLKSLLRPAIVFPSCSPEIRPGIGTDGRQQERKRSLKPALLLEFRETMRLDRTL